jgi:hypothetical protein
MNKKCPKTVPSIIQTTSRCPIQFENFMGIGYKTTVDGSQYLCGSLGICKIHKSIYGSMKKDILEVSEFFFSESGGSSQEMPRGTKAISAKSCSGADSSVLCLWQESTQYAPRNLVPNEFDYDLFTEIIPNLANKSFVHPRLQFAHPIKV